MPTVAELDVQVNANDDASATILALDALIKSLDGDDVDIDVTANTEEVQAKIRELLLRLQQLDTTDPDIDIDINSAGAAAELARLRAELDAMRNETIRVRVNSDEIRRGTVSMSEFRNSATQASRSVSVLLASVLGLGTALIPIGAVGVAGVMALVAALSTAAIGVGLFGAVAVTVFSGVKTALKEITKAQDDYNKATTDAERDLALEKLKQIMDNLDPATRKMVQSILDFKAAWRDFSMQFQPQIFQIAQEGLAGLAALLPSLAPIVSGVAGAFLSLERAAIAALQGPFWQSFFDMIGSNVAPILNQLGRALGNIIEGFAGMIMAFMPFTRDFTSGLLDMTRSFADWSKGLEDNQGFQNFIAYVRENTPLVLGLIGAMVGAFVALVKAGAPLGEQLIIIATNMFEAMSAFQQAHPQAATLGLALLGILVVALKLIGPALQIGHLFMVLGSIVLSLGGPLVALAGFLGIAVGWLVLIIAVIAAVVGALIYAYTHFDGFREAVDNAAGAVKDFAINVYDAVVTGLGNVVAWLQTTFGPAMQTVADFAVEQFNKIRDWVNENSATFQEAWDNIVIFVTAAIDAIGMAISVGLAVISAIWNAVWPTLSTIISGVWEAIKGIISGALDIIMGIILMWAGILTGNWGTIWDGLVQILRGIWEIIAGIVEGAFIILQALVDAGMAVVMAAMQAGWNLLVAGVTSAWQTIVDLVTAAWNGITTAVSAGMNAIQDVINAGWAAIIAVVQGALALLLAGLQSAWATIVAISTATWNAIVAVLTAAWNAIVVVATTAWNLLVAGITSAWNTIQQITTSVWNAILSFLTTTWNAIQTVITTTMALIQSAITTAWNAIMALIRTVMASILSNITSAWNTILSTITSVMNTILSTITSAWRTITSAIQTAMNNIINAIQSGLATALSTIVRWGSNAVSAVTSLAGQFFSAGASIMSSLASGIVSGIGNAVGAVQDAIGRITSLLPGSPAKTGPLSGQGYALIRGQHLAQDLAAGMASRTNLIEQAAGDIADLMTLNLNSSAAFDAIANGGSGGIGGGGISITIAPGAIVLQVGDGVSPDEAREAFDGAASTLAEQLLTAIQRR